MIKRDKNAVFKNWYNMEQHSNFQDYHIDAKAIFEWQRKQPMATGRHFVKEPESEAAAVVYVE